MNPIHIKPLSTSDYEKQIVLIEEYIESMRKESLRCGQLSPSREQAYEDAIRVIHSLHSSKEIIIRKSC